MMTQRNKIISWIIAGFFLLGIILWYWHHTIVYPSTDDAYVQANVVQVAAEVSGNVIETNVVNNQFVAKDTVLFKIDPRPFEIALERAQAQLALAKQAMGANQDAVNVAKALVEQRQAELHNAELNYQRTMPLVKNGTVAKAQGDGVTAQLAVAKAGLKSAQQQLQQALDELGQTGDANAQLRQAQAVVNQAQLDLEHTIIRAPQAGIVSNFNLRPGDVVASGQPLFVFVENEFWWIEANFKETDLQRLRAGQKAKIAIDTYPNTTFHGEVISISRGSGSTFSLLPPENATGNWVKVTQRFPVRVKILNPDPQKYPLRVGASSTVTIDTVD
ncbi:MAG: HlyD family secretion protein [Legionellales bacterium]|nr:HlyD family secretion protein [Legionellales bacterium]